MIKYRIALILWPADQNKMKEYPIYLRFRINGELRYIATGHYIRDGFWDKVNQAVKDNHLRAGIINPEIHDLKTKVQNLVLTYKIQGEHITADQVKKQFSKGYDLHNIFDFIEVFKTQMQHKRAPGTLNNYEKYSRKLELYQKSKNLFFEDITPEFLQAYETALRNEGLDGNYIFANFKMLKTFFNAARKKKIINFYPFDQYENPEYIDKDKDYLTLKELDKWEELTDKLTDRVDKQAAVYFLHGCYCGLRVSDWYQFDYSKHVGSKHIRIRATKNGEPVSMPITSRLKRNLLRIKELPLNIEEHSINRSIKELAAKLKINKHLTSHCARKTFAVTMCADQGIGVEVCATLMGITIETCVRNYYRVTGSKINNECLQAWGKL